MQLFIIVVIMLLIAIPVYLIAKNSGGSDDEGCDDIEHPSEGSYIDYCERPYIDRYI
jgi:ABC-type cobalt transport system substrate-binding protein